MMKRWFVLIPAAVMMFSAQAGAEERLESIAMTIADYLSSGRAVIAENQPLINDPSKGDKGFTPQAYEEQVNLEFLMRSGIKIKSLTPSDDFNKTLIAIHESAKEVIAGAQSQINEPGKVFKGFIPAVSGKRVGDMLYKKTGIVMAVLILRRKNSETQRCSAICILFTSKGRAFHVTGSRQEKRTYPAG
jgi:general secretion pathway protein A